MRLTAVDAKAEWLGLQPGMALASARARVPALKVMAANAPADSKLLARLADWCDGYSPFVAMDAPRGLFLDVTGSTHLFGGEQAMLQTLKKDLRRQGFEVQAALAGTAMAARALARYRDEAVVPVGGDHEALSGLPVEALALDASVTHAFRRAGLKTVGKVASRSRAELTARFGAAMVARLDTALGYAETPISPRLTLPPYRVERRFPEPVSTEAVMLACLKQLAGYLAKSLEERGEGARMLEAVFFRADGAIRRIAVETGSPTRDPALLERLFREKLDALIDPLDPGFGFDLIRLEALRSEACRDDAAQLGDKAADEKQIHHLIDRLAARFGSARVLAFRAQDTHIPERAFAAVPAQYAESAKHAWKALRRSAEAPRRPLRQMVPEPVSILSDNRFRWRNVVHRISRMEGPERIAMEWWRAPGPARDYFRVEDDEGRRYWLYKEEGERWFMHGVFA
ncbi:protein ImuB [Rhizomicrobium palustre]|uniref:DNA-directed DNA polymerase n=2 Tax=Rhizomicrobium palustre TaxID=189966 RepID=A0A846MZ99_9PROT|nr:protein ImuB [Rhizomicrobium palustre]